MRILAIVWALCLVGSPVLGAPVLYTFNTKSGNVVLNEHAYGSTSAGLTGTFAVTVDDGAHIGTGDTFILENSDLRNTGTMRLTYFGLATATILPGSARFLDFAPVGSEQIPAGGGPIQGDTDVYLQVTILITGQINEDFTTTRWSDVIRPFTASITTSAAESQTVTASLAATWRLTAGMTDIHLTYTLDMILSVEGTAHVVPDPALGGLTALGLVGAGAWLRRRPRSSVA